MRTRERLWVRFPVKLKLWENSLIPSSLSSLLQPQSGPKLPSKLSHEGMMWPFLRLSSSKLRLTPTHLQALLVHTPADPDPSSGSARSSSGRPQPVLRLCSSKLLPTTKMHPSETCYKCNLIYKKSYGSQVSMFSIHRRVGKITPRTVCRLLGRHANPIDFIEFWKVVYKSLRPYSKLGVQIEESLLSF